MNNGNELHKIVSDIREGKNVDLKKIEEYMTCYGERPDEESFTFSDPLIAETLNEAYRKEKGTDHENYKKHQSEIVDGLLKDKEVLLEAGAYKKEYFEQIEQLKSGGKNQEKSEDIDRSRIITQTKSGDRENRIKQTVNNNVKNENDVSKGETTKSLVEENQEQSVNANEDERLVELLRELIEVQSHSNAVASAICENRMNQYAENYVQAESGNMQREARSLWSEFTSSKWSN